MLDLYEWIMQHRDKPLTAASFVFLAVFIFDRLGRKLITNQLKRLFHMDEKEEFQKFNTRQKRIESKLDLLLQREGIVWQPVVTLDTKQGISVKKKKKQLKLRLVMSLLALIVVWSINFLRRMKSVFKNINKVILVPLLSAIALFVKQAFGYEVPDAWIDGAANVVMFLVMLLGLFLHPKKGVVNNDTKFDAIHYTPENNE